MTGVFDDAAMVSTVLRVRDVGASVVWYREMLDLDPIYVGSDGPEHSIAVYSIAGAVVSLWQLPAGQQRRVDDNDRNSYVVVVINGELETARLMLMGRGLEVGEIRRSENHEFLVSRPRRQPVRAQPTDLINRMPGTAQGRQRFTADR